MHWSHDAVFYHLYPLGCLGAPARNDLRAQPVPRLEALHDWIPRWVELGIDALYIGPLFESTAHGYDTADYFKVDRRLGDVETLRRLIDALHQNGIRVVLDGVLNHVGRDFWAFRDLQANQQASRYVDWFSKLDFTRKSPPGDPFWYEGWSGHYDLVKLNVANPEVTAHLFEAVRQWISVLDIDGLRLDAADVLSREFQAELGALCRGLKPDFWLMGEVVHGDYRRWVAEGKLDAVTNYELYKGLYSSHNDRNYFELAHSLDRQFGPKGVYRDISLYTFADNHDVDRIASRLREPEHLYPLHLLLFTMPGPPSIYYGSETGILGKKGKTSDTALRPALTPDAEGPHPELRTTIRKLIALRHKHRALRRGGYQMVHVAAEQFVFLRTDESEPVLVAVNAAAKPVLLTLPAGAEGYWIDGWNGERWRATNGRLEFVVPPRWGRVMTRVTGA